MPTQRGRAAIFLLAMAAFGSSALLPGVGHGCGMSRGFELGRSAEQHVAGAPGHHHGARVPAPGSSSDCHCVGVSCCSTVAVARNGTAWPVRIRVAVAVPVPAVAAEPGAPQRPPYSLPLAQGPPSLLS
jgi:hypothetical protein